MPAARIIALLETQPTYDHESGIEPGPHWWKASAITTTPSQASSPDFNIARTKKGEILVLESLV